MNDIRLAKRQATTAAAVLRHGFGSAGKAHGDVEKLHRRSALAYSP